MKKIVLVLSLFCALFVTVGHAPQARAAGAVAVNFSYNFDLLWDHDIFALDFSSYQLECPQLQVAYAGSFGTTYAYVSPFAYRTGFVPGTRPPAVTLAGCDYRLTHGLAMGLYTVTITPVCPNGNRSGVVYMRQTAMITTSTVELYGSSYGPLGAKNLWWNTLNSCALDSTFYNNTQLNTMFVDADGTTHPVSTSWQ